MYYNSHCPSYKLYKLISITVATCIYMQSHTPELRDGSKLSSHHTLAAVETASYTCSCTGVGSMGAPGASVPMKFLSGTHTKSTLCSELQSVFNLIVYTYM